MELLPQRPTSHGSSGSVTGDVWFDVIAGAETGSTTRVTSVRFAPRARTPWHTHGHGQTLHVTDGFGIVGTRDHIIVMRPGDTVHTQAGEEHWHGALPDHFMVHLAIWEDGAARVGPHVTDEEYDAAVARQR